MALDVSDALDTNGDRCGACEGGGMDADPATDRDTDADASIGADADADTGPPGALELVGRELCPPPPGVGPDPDPDEIDAAVDGRELALALPGSASPEDAEDTPPMPGSASAGSSRCIERSIPRIAPPGVATEDDVEDARRPLLMLPGCEK